MSRSRIGESGRKLETRFIMDMGEAETPEKAWLVGRGGGRGEMPDSGDGVYVDGDDV